MVLDSERAEFPPSKQQEFHYAGKKVTLQGGTEELGALINSDYLYPLSFST